MRFKLYSKILHLLIRNKQVLKNQKNFDSIWCSPTCYLLTLNGLLLKNQLRTLMHLYNRWHFCCSSNCLCSCCHFIVSAGGVCFKGHLWLSSFLDLKRSRVAKPVMVISLPALQACSCCCMSSVPPLAIQMMSDIPQHSLIIPLHPLVICDPVQP